MSEHVHPDFVIAGAIHSGASALFRLLLPHPKVRMSPHEQPHFFSFGLSGVEFTGPGDDALNRKVVRTASAYRDLYRGSSGKVSGEASWSYLYDNNADTRLREWNPDIEAIVVLRDPVDRAVSSFSHASRLGFETEQDFSAALDIEERRIQDGYSPLWHYFNASRYEPQLRRLYAAIPQGQVKIVDFDELASDPDAVLAEVCRFLGIQPSPPPEPATSNGIAKTLAPVRGALDSVLSMRGRRAGLSRRVMTPPAPVLDELRQRLMPDIEGVNQLTGKSMAWSGSQRTFTIPRPELFDVKRPPPEHAPTCVFIGELNEHEGLDDVLLAARHTTDVKFLVYGTPLGDYPQLSEDVGVSDRVMFIEAPIEALPDVLQRADMALAPRRYDGDISETVLAYQAAGLPVVGTDVAGIRELVDQETGRTVAVNDPGALAECIQELAHDGGLCRWLGAEARKRAQERYSTQRVEAR